MAQTGNDILKQLLIVTKNIDKKIGNSDGKSKSPSGKADAGTGSISPTSISKGDSKKSKSSGILDSADAIVKLSKVSLNIKTILGIKLVTKSLSSLSKIKVSKHASSYMIGVAQALQAFSSGKIKRRTIKNSAAGMSLLFKAFDWAGRHEKTIQSGINLFTAISTGLSKALPSLIKMSTAFTSVMKSFGIAILLIAGGIWAASKLLGVPIISVVPVIFLVILGFVGAFYLLGKAGPAVKKGAQTAALMGLAMMSIGVGLVVFAKSILLVGKTLGGGGVSGKSLFFGVLGMFGLIILAAGAISLIGLFDKQIRKGAVAASLMGLAMAALGFGMLQFARAINEMKGTAGEPEAGAGGSGDGPMGAVMQSVKVMGMVGLVLIASAIAFAIMGAAWKPILKGVFVALAVAVGLAGFAFAVSYAVGLMNSFADNSKKQVKTTDKDGNEKLVPKERSGMGKMFAGMGPGLGMIGIVLVASSLLFALLGLPPVALVVGLGIVVALGIAASLYGLALGVEKILNVAKAFPEIDGKSPGEVIAGFTSDIIIGFTKGVSDGISGGKDSKGGLAGFKQKLKNLGNIKTGINILKGMGKALSQFAKGISAFADVGNMRVIEGYDDDGKPQFGERINVKDVGETISTTISTFLTGLIKSTSGLTKDKAKAIKKLGRALTGRRGILSAVIQFSDVLKAFGEFGAGKIGYVTPKLNKNGEVQYDSEDRMIMTSGSADVSATVDIIVSNFSTFVNKLVTSFADFNGKAKRKMKNVAKALVGTWKTPGILQPIVEFANVLQTYASFGADGGLPLPLKRNEKGEIIPGQEQTYVAVEDIAANMVVGLSKFVNALVLNFTDDKIKASEKAGDQIRDLSTLIVDMSEIAKVSEDLMTASDSITKLAKSITALSASLVDLDSTKLKMLIDAQPSAAQMIAGGVATVAKGAAKFAGNIAKAGAKALGFGDEEESTDDATESSDDKSSGSDFDKLAKAINENNKNINKLITKLDTKDNFENLAPAIGQQVAASFKSSQFVFDFKTDKSGVMSLS